METLKVEVKKIRFHDDNSKRAIFEGLTKIEKLNSTGKKVKVKSRENFKGTFLALYIGDELEVTGYWKNNEKFGREFIIAYYKKIIPQTIKGIQIFLKQTVKGVGPKRVKAITDKYKEQSLTMIAKDIKNLDIIPNLSDSQKENIWLAVTENQHFENLLAFMQMNDLDYTLALKVYEKYKEDSIRKIKNNPYILLLEEITSFTSCDQIAVKLEIDKDSFNRVYAGVYDFINKDVNVNGNLYTKKEYLKKNFGKYLRNYGKMKGFEIESEKIDKILDKLNSDGLIVLTTDDENKDIIYLKNNYYIENKIVENMKRKFYNADFEHYYNEKDIKDYIYYYEKSSKIKMDRVQKEAVVTTMTEPISILTGGPGTGKTQTMATIINCIKSLTPSASISLCSPTGKAAKRMSEMSGMKASTIHRLIRIFDTSLQDQDKVINEDFLIVDEASMIDAFVFYRLISSLGNNVRLIIIGDHNQLPSVGAGLILRDLIDSKTIPTIKLTKIFRQKEDSSIITNSHKILKGEVFNRFKISKDKDGDFYFFERSKPEDINDMIMEIINRLIKNMKIPLSKIQVISPIKKTVLGTEQLNRTIQKTFNENTDFITYGENILGQGDKVIHIENDYDLKVFNGETGVVDKLNYLDHNSLTVSYPEKDVDYSKWNLEKLELAYAITAHKSQGSEFPVVIIPIHDIVEIGLYRNLIYTAVTRAKSKVIFVGDKEVFEKCLNKERVSKRNSMIKLKLQKYIF
jgi:exodeoxyribonuclease V alpha subunit